MDENRHSFSWGGYRPGAGQKPKWKSGPTVTIRVPQLLTSEVMLYAQLIDGQYPSGLQTEDCLSCQLENAAQQSQAQNQLIKRDRPEIKQQLDSVTESSYQEALEILCSALNLKANAGGAIKAEIKRALNLLDPQASL